MVADVAAVAAAHPDIVQRFSIGKTLPGPDDVGGQDLATTSPSTRTSPRSCSTGCTHSDEHMGLEMTLQIMHWLADGYGHDARITNIVNTREIWIVFAVNPDGAEYDIAGGHFHFWRKNRQPNAGHDRDRDRPQPELRLPLGHRRGRTSKNPLAITYMGPSAFSAPETRTMRDFLASRVVDGRQQIRTAITFHESGRLVMWPYGYTLRERPVGHDGRRPRRARRSSAGTWPRRTATSRSRRATCT